MNETVMQDKKHGTQFIDHTPKTPFLSPLQKYMKTHCDKCDFKGVKCRLEDSRGLTPMNLCVALYPLETFTAQGFPVPPEPTQQIEEETETDGHT